MKRVKRWGEVDIVWSEITSSDFCNCANVRQSSNKKNELLRLVAQASFMRMGSGRKFSPR